MMKFLKGTYALNSHTRRTISLAAWSAIAVFFFILLFSPFELPEGRLTETLFLVAGMGLVSFFSFVLFLVLLPRLLPKWFLTGEWEEGPSDLLNFAAWVVSATGMSFYLRYVVRTPLSLPLVVRIILICLMPSIFIRVDMRFAYLKRRIEAQKPSSAHYVPSPEQVIDIHSERDTEIVRIPSDRLLYIKAADNYIEVISQDGESIQSQLIRTTLKKVSLDLDTFPQIIQCHRAFIVNTEKVIRMRKSKNGSVLAIQGVDEGIPVSRAYQIRVKEILNAF